MKSKITDVRTPNPIITFADGKQFVIGVDKTPSNGVTVSIEKLQKEFQRIAKRGTMPSPENFMSR